MTLRESPILAAIEAEREELRARLGQLDELEAHARRVLGGEAPPQPKPERKPKAAKAAEVKPKRESKATAEASVLRELGKGAATSPALQEATGRPQATVDAVLRKLFAKGKVHHDDATPRKWALMPQVHRDNGNGTNGEHPREDWPHTEKQVRAQAVSEDQREEEREGNVKRRREGAPRGGTMLPPEPRSDEESQPAETDEAQDVGTGDADETVAYTERRLRRLFGRTPATFDEAVAAIDAPRDAAETALATLVAAGDVSKMQDGRYCA